MAFASRPGNTRTIRILCTVPGSDSPCGLRLRTNPFTPDGIRGDSAAPASLAVLQPAPPPDVAGLVAAGQPLVAASSK
jgi:hypothetical protein